MNEADESPKPKKKRGRKRGNAGPSMDKTLFGGRGRLNADEEQKLSQLTDAEMEQEITKYLLQMESVTLFSQGSLYGTELRRFKSFVHVYTSRPNVFKRMEMNVHILYGRWRNFFGCRVYAKYLSIHPSYIWRLLKGTGWSWAIVFACCLALRVKPSVLLFKEYASLGQMGSAIGRSTFDKFYGKTKHIAVQCAASPLLLGWQWLARQIRKIHVFQPLTRQLKKAAPPRVLPSLFYIFL